MRRRRIQSPWTSLAAPILALSSLPLIAASQQPFLPVQTAAPVLLKRQSDGCLANFYSCSSSGSQFNNICCQIGQTCALDQGNNPACCPANAVCTGTAPSQFTPPTGAPAVSYLPNAYFSFPYIPTVFAGPAACSAAVSQCSANSAACASDLAGGGTAQGYAVTVIVPGGGGVTVSHTNANLGTAAASSVCASLSSAACFGIQGGVCTQGSNGVFVVGSSNPAVPTAAPRCAVVGAVAAGVGFGVWGL